MATPPKDQYQIKTSFPTSGEVAHEFGISKRHKLEIDSQVSRLVGKVRVNKLIPKRKTQKHI